MKVEGNEAKLASLAVTLKGARIESTKLDLPANDKNEIENLIREAENKVKDIILRDHI